jgi:restriction system protein
MANYLRVILGAKNIYSQQCVDESFIGVDFGLGGIDFTGKFFENWREFNQENISLFLQFNPEKTKISAGLACGMTWTVCKYLKIGDIVLSPDGEGFYYIGKITSDYVYTPNQILPHRRFVTWYPNKLEKKSMSLALRSSLGSIGTTCDVTKYSLELETLLSGNVLQTTVNEIENDENTILFGLEKHLEEFLVSNWKNTELGKEYDIFEDTELGNGQQFQVETGRIDILAISKDKKELVVVELKKGRVSDVVVGQTLRYMGDVKEVLATTDQTVKGIIIALEDDLKLRRALSVTNNIEYFNYEVQFKLNKK